MKKIFIIVLTAVLALQGCDKMLDTTNYEKYDTSSFPKSQKDAEQMVTSIYNRLNWVYREPEEAPLFVNDLASDDMFGGGSTSNTGAQGLDRLMWDEAEGFTHSWDQIYRGIFRANYAIEQIPALDDALFDSADTKNYLLGQAYFLRAWYDWEMADLFETFPLLTSPEPVNNPRTDVETVYKAIAEDLVTAINMMPAKYGYNPVPGYAGRATKYAAEALLARIWMFYTGFYGKNDLNGITKDQIIGWLKDCRDNSGFGLVDDPRNLWPYANEYSSGKAFGVDFGTYSNKENLKWVGNHSKETVWASHFSMVNREDVCWFRVGEYFGLRNPGSAANDKCYPYGIGYTNGTVNPKMVQEWVSDPDYGVADKRLFGSILSVDNASEVYSNGVGGNWWPAGYETELPNHDGNDSKEVEKTLFHNKKYIVVTAYADAVKSSIYNSFFHHYPGVENHNQYGQRADAIYIRFADVLLMLDELEQTTTGMNQLRARAGLAPYGSYSLEKLQKERRYEFVFEGLRWDDLRRWYPKDAAKIVQQNQEGAYVEYRGNVVPGGYTQIKGNDMVSRYEKTRGFWMIPPSQITISKDVLTQTPGWESDTQDSWFFSNGRLPYPTKY